MRAPDASSRADPALQPLEPLLAQLEQVLEHEMRVLGEGDPVRLDAIVTEKRTLLQRVDRLCREPAVAAALSGAARADGAPEALRDRLRRCRALNEAIGGAVAAAMRQNELSLQLLGHSSAPVTYGPGNATAHTGARPLATC